MYYIRKTLPGYDDILTKTYPKPNLFSKSTLWQTGDWLFKVNGRIDMLGYHSILFFLKLFFVNILFFAVNHMITLTFRGTCIDHHSMALFGLIPLKFKSLYKNLTVNLPASHLQLSLYSQWV